MISTSVGTGLGALAEEINKSADKTGVRATFTVETRGMAAVRAGTTSNDFAINGVTIGQVAYEDGDGNGALVAAINSVKDTTGVEASIDANGQLLLTSREGRGIKIDGNIGGGAFINANMKENYGRLSLVNITSALECICIFKSRDFSLYASKISLSLDNSFSFDIKITLHFSSLS